MGCGCASLALNSCSNVPITDRKQLRLIPEAKLNAQAEKLYEKIKDKEKLEEIKQIEFSEKIDELNQETDTLLEEIDKWQM